MSLLRLLRSRVRISVWGLLALLLLGLLATTFHHHVGGDGDPRCAVCTLAHSPADAPLVATVPTPTVLLTERVAGAHSTPPALADRSESQTRAPPLG